MNLIYVVYVECLKILRKFRQESYNYCLSLVSQQWDKLTLHKCSHLFVCSYLSINICPNNLYLFHNSDIYYLLTISGIVGQGRVKKVTLTY